VELHGITEEHGEAWYGGASRRPKLGFRLRAVENERARERACAREREEGREGDGGRGTLSPRLGGRRRRDMHRSGIERRGELHRAAPLSGGRG
jgi:hypothetical protein